MLLMVKRVMGKSRRIVHLSHHNLWIVNQVLIKVEETLIVIVNKIMII